MARVNLKISKEQSLPVDAATQKLGWIGTTGSGKTYGASKLAEQFWYAGAQFVVLDPVGVWYGLRLDKTGKKPSQIDIPVFGGLHGDMPLEPGAGKLLANLVVDKSLSAIIDVSQFESDSAKARFAADFADQFFFRKKANASAVHLFIEECQEFVPQNPQRGEERMLHAFVRMQKLGRNFGIGSSYITQRPQEVNKKALNMAQTLFVFRNTGTHERKAIELWIKDNSLDENIANDLPKIPTGQCHIWSPEFLKISEMVHILEKDTFNASATPEVGKKKVKAASLASIDIEALRESMAETIATAERDDPSALRKRISMLETELKKKPTGEPGPMGVSQWFEFGRKYGYVDFFEKKAEETIGKMRFALTTASSTLRQIAELTSRPEVRALAKEQLDKIAPPPAVVSKVLKTEPKTISPGAVVRVPGESPEGLDSAMQKVLNAIAWMNSIGVAQPQKPAVAFVAGYSPSSSGFQNACGGLRSRGLVVYPEGNIELTDTGRQAAQEPDGALSNEVLHQKILAKLSGQERLILAELINLRGIDIHKEQLAERIDKSWTSSGFQNACGKLRSLGLVKYPGPNMIAAEEILFPL